MGMEEYETVRKLPQKGGFGEIFIVRKKAESGGGKGSPTFILKRARLAKMSDEDKWRLHNEVEVHRSVQRGLPDQHENIVAFKESFADRKVFGCIVLEHCKGGDLLSKVNIARKKEQIIPEEQCLTWFSQITSAVECLHAEGILHRDLKLANCFLTGGDEPMVKLGDFGLACQLPEGCECAEEKCGTITAMAPELILHGWGTYKSDVWALGTILYELTTHGAVFEVPFDSFGLDIRRYKAAMSRAIKPIPDHYSKPLRGMTEAILRTEADDRPMAAGVMKMLHEWPSNAPEPLERKQTRIDRVGSKVDCGMAGGKAAAAGAKAPAPAPAPPAARKQPASARLAGGAAAKNDPGGVMRKAKALAAAEVPPTASALARRSAARNRQGSVIDRLTAKPGGGAAALDNETPRFGRRAPVARSAKGRGSRIKSAGPIRSPSKVAGGGAAATPATPPAAKPGRRPNSATVKGSPPAVRELASEEDFVGGGCGGSGAAARTAARSLVAEAAAATTVRNVRESAQDKAAALEAARQRAQLAVKSISAKAANGGSAKTRPLMGSQVECWCEKRSLFLFCLPRRLSSCFFLAISF